MTLNEEQFNWKIEVFRVAAWMITKKYHKSSYLSIKPKNHKAKETKKCKTNDRHYTYFYKLEGLRVTTVQLQGIEWVISY